MNIPHASLSSTALRAIIQEFVSRDGTDHSAMEARIERVLHLLDVGLAEVQFDRATESCNIVIS